MAENDQRRLPVVDLGRLLSPEAFSKLQAGRQRREQAERAQVLPFNEESSQNDFKKTDSGDNSLKDTHQSEKEASADAEEHHDGNNMDASMSSSDDSLKETCPCEIESKKTGSGDNSLKETHQSEKESIVAEERDGGGNNMDATMSETATASFEEGPDNMQMSEDTTHGDSNPTAVATKFTSLSLGPIKKRKRPETTSMEEAPQSFDLSLGARDGIRNGFDFAVARLVEHTASNNTVPCSLLSAYRSIPLSLYRRSTCSSTTTPNETMSTPSLGEIANYPDYCQQTPWKGTKVCILCGERRPYKTRISSVLVPIIRPSGKCICTSCQIQVWVNDSTLYKWCNKCKKMKRVELGNEKTLLTCKDCRQKQKDGTSRRKKQERV